MISKSIEVGAKDSFGNFDINKTQNLITAFTTKENHTIDIFDPSGQKIIDGKNFNQSIAQTIDQKNELASVKMLKDTAAFFTQFLPENKKLPPYPANNTPDVNQALNGTISLSAWTNENDSIIFSAAAPIIIDNHIVGAVLLTRNASDVEKDIADVWINILKIFTFTLLITIALSIYLSGVIASPLRKLANAAEKIRTGRFQESDIPDLSNRNDEIGELSIAFRTMMKALWARMDSIESFAADVSHELKNPLTSLRSALETLDRVTKKSDKEKLMAIIHHDITRMDRLITDISNASRLDAEISREAFAHIDLKPVLENLTDFYTELLRREKNDITITLTKPDQTHFYIMGNEPRLEQLFRNLIDNAISFSPKNGKILITLTHQSASVLVTIEDEGPGIPEDKRKSIFDRFYSQRPEDEDYGRHSGLGLSICKQIIDAHGGEISAENIKNKKEKISGARFRVVFKAG